MLFQFLLIAGVCGFIVSANGCSSDCREKLGELRRVGIEQPSAEDFLGQVYGPEEHGGNFTSIRIAGGVTHIFWCGERALRWMEIVAHRGGNELRPIESSAGLYLLKVWSSGSVSQSSRLFLLDESLGNVKVLLAISSCIEGLTDYYPAEEASHTVELDYPRLQLIEKWEYYREGSPLDSDKREIGLMRDSTTGILFQKMVYLESVTLIRGTGEQRSDTTLRLMKEVPVVETRLDTSAYIDGFWCGCEIDYAKCWRRYSYGEGVPSIAENE